jgi:hypothetical protein
MTLTTAHAHNTSIYIYVSPVSEARGNAPKEEEQYETYRCTIVERFPNTRWTESMSGFIADLEAMAKEKVDAPAESRKLSPKLTLKIFPLCVITYCDSFRG